MKHVQAAAAQSTAQSILYPSDDAAPEARTGKKVLHNGGACAAVPLQCAG